MEPSASSIETTPLTSSTTTNTSKSIISQQAFRPDDELPTNVETTAQLALLPPECLSGDKQRPLRHVDDRGNVYHYALKPMTYSVILILMVELLERFSFYGIYYTLTLYVTGVYNEDWNAGLTSVDAASFVSVSTAVAYSTPFVGAILADVVLGDYKSIILGAFGLYLPGIILVTLTTIPYLLGETFNKVALAIAVLVLWPMGTGIVKSIVNVCGAKQFHPLLQSSIIEQYYVNFYMTINIGALSGITLIPILAQHNVTHAYMIPCVMLTLGVATFVAGTPRYVLTKPRGELFSSGKSTSSNTNTIGLSTIFRITILIVPFCIAYSQMPTTFIVQGTVMSKAFGFIDAATINGLDGLSVLVFGYITGSKIYPALAKRGIKLPTTYKFAIGSFLGSLAIAWSLVVEFMIHRAYAKDGSQVCVAWQAPAYILIGWGEIFAVSAAYEVAFTASAPEKKVLASATNIFCVGGIPNVLCTFLYQACDGWFRNSTRGDLNISHVEDYATAHVYKYFFVLMCILIFGIILNTLPSVRDFVDSVETRAAELVKTPRMTPPTKRPPSRQATDEESPLLQKDQQYVKRFGKGPVLYKMGSMRAGPSLGHKEGKAQHVKYKYIPKLYNNKTGTPKIVPPKRVKKAESASSLPRYDRRDSV